MDHRDHRRFPGGISAHRREQPALRGEALVGPADAARAHHRCNAVIVMGELLGRGGGSGEDRGRMRPVLHHRRDGLAVVAERGATIARRKAGRAREQRRAIALVGHGNDLARVAVEQGRAQAALGPIDRGCGRLGAVGEVDRRAARKRHGEDIAADRAEIAHQPADECNRFAIGRDAREIELRRRLRNRAHRAGRGIDMVERRDPPIGVAIAQHRGDDKAAAIGRPVIFIDIAPRRRHRLDRVGGERRRAIEHRELLRVILLADFADLTHTRLRGAGFLGGADCHQQRDPLAVGREARGLGDALHRRDGAHQPAFNDVERHFALRPVARQKGERAVGRERQPGIAARRCAGIERRQHGAGLDRTHHDLRLAAARLDRRDPVPGGGKREAAIVDGRGKRRSGSGRKNGGDKQAHGH